LRADQVSKKRAQGRIPGKGEKREKGKKPKRKTQLPMEGTNWGKREDCGIYSREIYVGEARRRGIDQGIQTVKYGIGGKLRQGIRRLKKKLYNTKKTVSHKL